MPGAVRWFVAVRGLGLLSVVGVQGENGGKGQFINALAVVVAANGVVGAASVVAVAKNRSAIASANTEVAAAVVIAECVLPQAVILAVRIGWISTTRTTAFKPFIATSAAVRAGCGASLSATGVAIGAGGGAARSGCVAIAPAGLDVLTALHMVGSDCLDALRTPGRGRGEP